MKDSSHLYEVEHRAEHATRPGFRITELRISATQKVPWHFHSNVQDTFYVIEGHLRLFLREPKQEVRLYEPMILYTTPVQATRTSTDHGSGGSAGPGGQCRALRPPAP